MSIPPVIPGSAHPLPHQPAAAAVSTSTPNQRAAFTRILRGETAPDQASPELSPELAGDFQISHEAGSESKLPSTPMRADDVGTVFSQDLSRSGDEAIVAPARDRSAPEAAPMARTSGALPLADDPVSALVPVEERASANTTDRSVERPELSRRAEEDPAPGKISQEAMGETGREVGAAPVFARPVLLGEEVVAPARDRSVPEAAPMARTSGALPLADDPVSALVPVEERASVSITDRSVERPELSRRAEEDPTPGNISQEARGETGREVGASPVFARPVLLGEEVVAPSRDRSAPEASPMARTSGALPLADDPVFSLVPAEERARASIAASSVERPELSRRVEGDSTPGKAPERPQDEGALDSQRILPFSRLAQPGGPTVPERPSPVAQTSREPLSEVSRHGSTASPSVVSAASFSADVRSASVGREGLEAPSEPDRVSAVFVEPAPLSTSKRTPPESETPISRLSVGIVPTERSGAVLAEFLVDGAIVTTASQLLPGGQAVAEVSSRQNAGGATGSSLAGGTGLVTAEQFSRYVAATLAAVRSTEGTFQAVVRPDILPDTALRITNEGGFIRVTFTTSSEVSLGVLTSFLPQLENLLFGGRKANRRGAVEIDDRRRLQPGYPAETDETEEERRI